MNNVCCGGFLKFPIELQKFITAEVWSGWPSGLRRQTQGENPLPSKWYRVFWSPNGGVGSNPTPDKPAFLSENVDTHFFVEIIFNPGY